MGLLAAVVPIAGVSSPHLGPSPTLNAPVSPRVILASVAAPAGSAVDAVLAFDIDPHWHIYYDGENDSGQPPTISALSLPEGVTLGPIRWATPRRQLLAGDILDSTYEKRVELPFSVAIGAKTKPGEYSGTLNLSWMECTDVCQFGRAEASWTLRVLPAGAQAEPSAESKAVASAIDALPKVWTPELAKTLKETLTIAAEISSTQGRLVVRAPKAQGIEYHARAGSVKLADAVKDGASKTDTLDALLVLGDNERVDPKAAVSGIVVVINERGVRQGYEVHFPVAKKPESAPRDAGPKK